MCVCQLVGESGSTVVEESQTVNDEVEFTEVRGLGPAAPTSHPTTSLARDPLCVPLWLCAMLTDLHAVVTQGLSVDRGYVSPYFVKDQERQVRPHT